MTRRVAWFGLGWLVLGAASAGLSCSGGGDDDGGPVGDGATGDGDGVDWPDVPEPPDASGLDAPSPPPADEICADLCFEIEWCSAEPDPGCDARCAEDMGDCSDDELRDLAECTRYFCSEEAYCTAEVACYTPVPYCRDGVCDPGESCLNCAFDCGGCTCGDGQCNGDESCDSCPGDCGSCFCGDGRCSPGECATCDTDCPDGCFCPHDECTPGDALDPGCGDCVASTCDEDPYCCSSSWTGFCVRTAEDVCGLDCPPVCGDGLCEEGENSGTCPNECPPTCGDGFCSEQCGFCVEDCGECVCGNGECEVEECGSCEADCPGCVCPHDVCTLGEPLDRDCGVCQSTVCSIFSYCCSGEWDAFCRLAADALCDVDCPAECGDGFCEPEESCGVCPADCC